MEATCGPTMAPRQHWVVKMHLLKLWSCGCWALVLMARGDERGQMWERSPSRRHIGSKPDVFQPSNQNHYIFLPKPRSACVFWVAQTEAWGSATKEGWALEAASRKASANWGQAQQKAIKLLFIWRFVWKMKGTKYVWVGKKPLWVGCDMVWELLQGCKGAAEELQIELIKESSEADKLTHPKQDTGMKKFNKRRIDFDKLPWSKIHPTTKLTP